MPWTQNDVRWIAARLMPEVYDINQRLKYERNTRRLEALYHELAPMKFRITQPVFFWGKERQVGEIMEAPVGPYKNTLVGGQGLVRVPQFEEIPVTEETQTVISNQAANPAPITIATSAVNTPLPASFAEATAAIVKPANKPATQAKTTASLLSQLATRRNKLHDTIKADIDTYAKRLADMETNAPAVFVKANTMLDDEQSGFKDLEDSLQEFAGANGAPLGQ